MLTFQFQTMSLCISCISRTLDCIPKCFKNIAAILEASLPSQINPVGGSVLLQMLIIITYEELLKWAKKEVLKEKSGNINFFKTFLALIYVVELRHPTHNILAETGERSITTMFSLYNCYMRNTACNQKENTFFIIIFLYSI